MGKVAQLFLWYNPTFIVLNHSGLYFSWKKNNLFHILTTEPRIQTTMTRNLKKNSWYRQFNLIGNIKEVSTRPGIALSRASWQERACMIWMHSILLHRIPICCESESTYCVPMVCQWSDQFPCVSGNRRLSTYPCPDCQCCGFYFRFVHGCYH